MTVSSTPRRAGPFLGNGVTTAFPFTFKVFTAADLEVTYTDSTGAETVLTTQYSVALNADQDNNPGGTITYPLTGTPLAVGDTLTVIGDLAAQQGTDITNLGRFLPQVIENALDYLTILVQQVIEKTNRALVTAVSDETPPNALPTAADRAGYYLAFDADGQPVMSSGTGADSGLRADLAVPATGASLVGFKQTYAGSQSRNALDKMSESVSALDFMLPGYIADLALATPLLDQTANIQAAIDSGARLVRLPKGNYKISGTIRLKDGVQLVGVGSLQGLGTSLRFSKNDGTHCFDSDPALYLSGVTVQGMEVLNTANVAGTVGTGDAFHLFGVTNNCKFKDVLIRNFGGSAFAIGKQTTAPADNTACGNVLFEQVFVVSCGGYAFDITGYVNAMWNMCDLNSCATGFFRVTGGVSNQAMMNIYSLWIEGTRAWSAGTVFDMVGTNGLMLNLFGVDAVNSNGGTSRIVKSTTTSCRLNVFGLTGTGWTYLHEDTPSGYNTTVSNPTTDFYNVASRQFQAVGAAPLSELVQTTGGTVDQRRFRESISSNNWLLTARDDAGASVRNLLFVNHNTGAFLPGVDNSYTLGGASNRWSLVYAGNGTINTSDAREKQQVRPLSDAERAVALRLKGLVRAFKFNDAVLAKGDGARIHVGVIAQDVKAAFEAEGLVGEHYGVLCFDEWDAEPAVLDAERNVEVPAKDAGDRYGVRYEQLLAFVIGAL